jgi:heme A synthase
MSSFRKLSIASLCTTFGLIAIGGLVRATKSGLGCGDDWPDCNGRLAPALETRAEIIEFSHRAVAGILVILLAVLMVSAIRNHRSERFIMWASIGAFLLVIGQALLGALVVWLHLKAESVVLHLSVALSLLALLTYLVTVTGEREKQQQLHRDRSLMRHAAGAAVVVFVLLLVGSYVSGKEAGLVFPDWPLMDGRAIPDVSGELEAIHFVHRLLAAVVGAIVLITGLRLIKLRERAPHVVRLAQVAMGLFAVEILIGALNVWTELNSLVVTAHLAVGAFIWASLIAAAISLHPAMDLLGERLVSRRVETPILEGSR